MGWQDDPVVDTKPAPAPAESAGVSAVAGWQADPVVADPYGGEGGIGAREDAAPPVNTEQPSRAGFSNISQEGTDILGGQAMKSQAASDFLGASMKAKAQVAGEVNGPQDQGIGGDTTPMKEKAFEETAQALGQKNVPYGQILPYLKDQYKGLQFTPADEALWNAHAAQKRQESVAEEDKFWSKYKPAYDPARDERQKKINSFISGIPTAAGREVAGGLLGASGGLARLGASPFSDNLSKELGSLNEDVGSAVDTSNEDTKARWLTKGIGRVTNALATSLTTGGAAMPVMALEATQTAGDAADKAGLSGHDKLLFQAGSGLLAALVAKVAGANTAGKVGADILTKAGAKQVLGELAHEAALLGINKFGDKVLGKVAGTDTTPIHVADLLKDAGDVVTDAILFKTSSTLPHVGEQGRADRAQEELVKQNKGKRVVEGMVRDNLARSGAPADLGPDETIRGSEITPAGQAPTEGLPHDEFEKTINSIQHPDQPVLDQFGLGAVNAEGKVDSGAETHVPGEKDATPVNERDFTKETMLQHDFAKEFDEQPEQAKRSGTYTFEDTETGEKITAKGEEEARKLIQEKANAEADKRGAQGERVPEDVRGSVGAGNAEAERGSAEPAAEAASAERGAAAGDAQSGAGDQGLDEKAGVAPTALDHAVTQIQAMGESFKRRPTRDEVMRRVKGVESAEEAGWLIRQAYPPETAPLKADPLALHKVEYTPEKEPIPQIAPKKPRPGAASAIFEAKRMGAEYVPPAKAAEALRKSFWKKATSTPKAAEVAPQEPETPSKAVPEAKPKAEDKQIEAGLMAHLPTAFVKGAETLISEANKAVKGSSLPETSAKSEVAADAVAAHAAANGGAAGEWLGKRWKNSVIPKGASEIDRKLVGAALNEKRFRFDAAQGRKDTPTMVGEGRPFATEQDYQDALKTPQVKDAIARIKASVQPEKTALFAKSEGYEAGDTLPPEYDGRISLIRADGEPDEAPTKVTGGAVRVRSNFGKSAKGTDWTAYETDVGKILDGMASESMKASTNKTMLDTLMKENLASFKDSKDRDIIKVNYPVRHTDKNGKAYIKTEELPLYVDKAIAPEVLKAMHKSEKSPVPAWVQTIGKGINAINTSGLALPLTIAGVSGESEGWKGKAYNILSAASPEFTTHAVKSVLTIATQNGGFKNAAMDFARTSGLNVFHALYGIGHAANDIAKNDPKVQAEMEKLANIGSLRPGSHGLISHVENASRLVMSRMFDNLVARGLREDTPTIRREFVNQLGQYTPGMQSDFVRVLKHLGVGPFAVAGTTGARVGAKSLLGISAGKSNAPITESGLQITRNLVLSAATAAALRAIIWKDREDDMPKGGLWDVPLPWRDGKGKYYNMDLLGTSMAARGMRTTGIGAGLEAKRQGLPMGMVADKAITSAGNALTMPMMGPVPQAAAVLATGKDVGFGQGFRKAKTAKPGESQYAENFKAMLKQMDPSVANTMDALDEESAGKDTWGNKAVQAIGRPFGLRTKADK